MDLTPISRGLFSQNSPTRGINTLKEAIKKMGETTNQHMIDQYQRFDSEVRSNEKIPPAEKNPIQEKTRKAVDDGITEIQKLMNEANAKVNEQLSSADTAILNKIESNLSTATINQEIEAIRASTIPKSLVDNINSCYAPFEKTMIDAKTEIDASNRV